MLYLKFKRVFDILAAGLALVLLAPLFLLTAIAIKLDSQGPVFFPQQRLGKDGKPFWMLKFRTMVLGAEKLGVYEQKNDPRVTRVGRVLRPLSINELPQFINVLKGDMSLIGPRPVLPDHPWDWSSATPLQRQRFAVKPGLTGWAAVNGRKDVPWDRRVELDAEYTEKISAWFDIKIIFMTIWVMIALRGIHNKNPTAPGAGQNGN